MVRRPLTVGTRVRVQLGGRFDPPTRYGVIEAVHATGGRCVSHPDDQVAYTVAMTDGNSAIYCDSQTCEV